MKRTRKTNLAVRRRMAKNYAALMRELARLDASLDKLERDL